MSNKELKTLEKVVKLYKDYEHGKLKEIPGKEIDILLKEALAYQKTLKDLRKNLEVRLSRKTAEEIYSEVFKLLRTVLGNKSQDALIKDFESSLVKKGKIRPRFLGILKELVNIKRKLKSGKLSHKEVDKAKKDAIEFVDSLVEYSQRSDLIKAKKGTMQISYKGKKAELVLLGKDNFLVEGSSIKRISKGKLINSDRDEFEKVFADNKGKLENKISSNLFSVLRKELGDFEVIL